MQISKYIVNGQKSDN